jgi:SagB-type dehydrogenase family enzyme
MPKAKREFLKGTEWNQFQSFETDQQKGFPRPDVQKPYPADAALFDLVPPDKFKLDKVSITDVISSRRSHRQFTDKTLSLEHLSFLLWATQGVRGTSEDGTRFYRNVPSGGNHHPIETYLSVHNVETLKAGLYRYLPLDHKLVLINEDTEISDKVKSGSMHQSTLLEDGPHFFIKEAPVVFIWSTIPYRSEWRYSLAAAKLVALDAGHVCQNLHIAASAIGAGSCSVGAYDQREMDRLIDVDGENEFVIYLSPVGFPPVE